MNQSYQNAYLLSISYDGSSYYGWVKQKTQSQTIQQTLEKSLVKVIKTSEFYLVGISKTDAKVHAEDQKVFLKVNFVIQNLSAFQDGVNKALPDDIHLNKIEPVDPNFEFRKVQSKTYEYTFNDGEYHFQNQRYETQLLQKIDEVKLDKICQLFVGEHDFFLFSGLSYAEKPKFQTTRVIEKISVTRTGDQVKITIIGPGFLRYQIRSIVGASLTCLTRPEKLNVDQIKEKLAGIGDKNKFVAKPNGLVLKKVTY